MSQTPGSPDGWLASMQGRDLSQEDFDKLKASFLAALKRGGPPVILPPDPPLWRRWWEWPAVQWWWYRQYKRADRRAFRRECRDIRWRETWKRR